MPALSFDKKGLLKSFRHFPKLFNCLAVLTKSLGVPIFSPLPDGYKPMSLKEKLLSNMKESMKAKDSIRLETVRCVISAVKNKEIDTRKDLEEEEIFTDQNQVTEPGKPKLKLNNFDTKV
jgi:hypothetical protein